MDTMVKLLSDNGVIISGSYALRAYGMLSPTRKVKSIDIVCTSEKELVKICMLLPNITINKQSNSPDYTDEHYTILGIDTAIKIDCFIYDTPIESLNVDGINYHHFKDIWAKKIKILLDRRGELDAIFYKHLADFNYYF